ncbi:MAG: CHRD domain-containing protein [Anaerolineae bacterium]|nr:CHRD domain-containing protein [Gloeobacterales cyanobacterium ES-bin-313]
MYKTIVMGAFAALALCTPTIAAPSPTLSAILLGGNEVGSTGLANAGDTDGLGLIQVEIAPEKGELCYSLQVDNLATPTIFHIHNAVAGVNGPIVIDLIPPTSADPGKIRKCVAVDPLLAENILNRPLEFYVNFHTEEFTSGAVRGQLFYRRF